MDEVDPAALSRALGEIPLFKEIQRLVLSQTGPVNWEIAGQIAKAILEAGKIAFPTGEVQLAQMEDAVRVAELYITKETGAESSVLTTVHVVDRKSWAGVNLEGFKPLVERLASRLVGQTGVQILDAIGPFAMGVQVGFLIGTIARSSLSQYDLCLPRLPAGHLYFVSPNIIEMERSLQLDPVQFRQWLAFHEVAHQRDMDLIEWVRPRFATLLNDFISSAEVDPERLMSQIQNVADPNQLNNLLERPEDLIPLLMTPAQEVVMQKTGVLMSVLEGLADLRLEQAGASVLPELDRIREATARHRVERSASERMMEKLLGVYLSPQSYRAGARFVKSIAGKDLLSELTKGAMSMPGNDELDDPGAWAQRILRT